MTFQSSPETDALLDQALALPSDERLAFIERAAAGRADLHALLTAVVREAEIDDPFLAPGAPLGGALGRDILDALDLSDDDAHALTEGERLGDFEITGVLGRGGMGEVYRARDVRLGRFVAIKVLPTRFASDPDRVARLRREARLLASLNHTNVGVIHGVAERDGVEALVLELVEGPTLADRIAAGPMPLGEAIAIARDVAGALEAAHDLGIVHRDLKPANIKLTAAGSAKVLDFGLARIAASGAPGDRVPASSIVEQPGIILGTAAYMSPEQARGAAVDARTDIWAFGCVLFEMLTGRRAFGGDSLPDILASVVEHSPDYSRLPPETPSSIRRLIGECLKKDPAERLGSIAAAREMLDAPPGVSSRQGRRRLMAAGAVALAALVLSTVWFVRESAPPEVTRRVLTLPDGDELVLGVHPVAAIAPDGDTVVYRARRNGIIQLVRRSVDEDDGVPLPGSENAATPFFSPDGRWIAFDADGTLKRISRAGGPALGITDAQGGLSAHWGEDHRIVYSTPTLRVLHAVDPEGGAPVALTRLDESRGELAHTQPFLVAGSDVVLFTIVRADAHEIAALRIATGRITPVAAGMQPYLLDSGHLLFARENALWVAPFDRTTLSLTGAPTLALDGLELNDIVYYAVSRSGTLAYVPRRAPAAARRLRMFDRQGRGDALPLRPAAYLRATLSPDDRRIALAIEEGGNTDVWVAELERGILTRITSHPTVDTAPLWSPDGRDIVFRSERDGGGLFLRAADASDDARRITWTDGPYHTPYSWTPDGRYLLFSELSGYRLQRIRRVGVADGRVETLLDGDFAQLRPRLSPDGRWLAYQSDESGRFEVYVRPYPGLTSARWQISPSGGTSPRWTPDGRELLFYDGHAVRTMPVRTTDGRFDPAPATPLFEVSPFMGRLGPDFDVTSDGRRLLMLEDAPALDGTARRAELVLLGHWTARLPHGSE